MATCHDNRRRRLRRRRREERRLALKRAEHDDWMWICGCGHIQDSPFHCSICAAEPPWGCDCGQHEPDEEFEWYEDGELPEFFNTADATEGA